MSVDIVVRMFWDQTDTVLWCPFPVEYTESHLDPGLVERLLAWAELVGQDPVRGFRPRRRRKRWLRDEGRRLARQVADALGEGFVVQLDGEEVFRSSRPASAPEAAAAFAALWAAEQ